MCAFVYQFFCNCMSFIVAPCFAEVSGFKLCLINSSLYEAGKRKIADTVLSIMGV